MNWNALYYVLASLFVVSASLPDGFLGWLFGHDIQLLEGAKNYPVGTIFGNDESFLKGLALKFTDFVLATSAGRYLAVYIKCFSLISIGAMIGQNFLFTLIVSTYISYQWLV